MEKEPCSQNMAMGAEVGYRILESAKNKAGAT